ncbi:MAG: hypothetical protein ACETWD_04405 [Desulfatiglandales bacterium]
MEPSLLKSLKLLRETKEVVSEKELAERIKEDHGYVKKALKKLVERKIITKNGELYRYQQTSGNEEFFKKLQAVYEKAIKRPRIELIVRGLLSDTEQSYPYQCYRNRVVLLKDGFAIPHLFRLKTLLKLLEDEGFDSGEIDSFLKEEIEKGWMGRVEFYLGSKENISSPFPPCIPFYYLWFEEGSRIRTYGRTREMELVVVYHGKGISTLAAYLSKIKQMSLEELEEYKRQFRERWRSLGWSIQEEEYLVGEYPLEIANPAREYLDREKPEIGKKISDEAFHRWFTSKAYSKGR